MKNNNNLQYLESLKDNINLDCMPKTELRKFYDFINPNSLTQKRILNTNKKGLQSLKNYAINKFVAMDLREIGNIKEALLYEEITEKIYNNFPENLKW